MKKKINSKTIKVLEYNGFRQDVKLKCTICGNTWTSSYNSILKYKKCPTCNPKPTKEKKAKIVMTEKEKMTKKLSNYQYKISLKSNSTIQILNYKNSKEKVTAKCLRCGYEWTSFRADHLLERCYCPKCKYRF